MPIDTRLKWLLEERNVPTDSFHEAIEVVAGSAELINESSWRTPRPIDVLVRAQPSATHMLFENELLNFGFELHSLSGPAGALTASGTVQLDEVENLERLPSVLRIEVPRELQPELLVSLRQCTADQAHSLIPHANGSSAVVAIIDGGIDYTHPVLRQPNGATRILALWDQADPTLPTSIGVPYGRVYTQAAINAALAPGGASLNHADPGGHGTHVTSCAAGSAPRNGVAHAADLLVVSLTGNGQTLGRSKNAVDAFDWIVNQAQQFKRPVAINMSQGMNSGGHSGTSMLELVMDAHCRRPGVAIIKSAGNEQEWRTHASGTLTSASPLTFEVVCSATKRTPGQLELWFDAGEDVDILIEPPSGVPTMWFNAAMLPRTMTLAGGNTVRVDIDYDPEGTGDNVYTVFFSSGGTGIGIMPGTWRVRLRTAKVSASGLVHAWLERTLRDPPSEQLRFSTGSNDPTCTLSIPGTARRVICVGSYVTTPDPPGSALVGALSSFSSRGPTRHGVQKPDLIAPGEVIEAARSKSFVAGGGGQWTTMAGTSMAAPHVAGAAAILLAEDPTLTGEQVRQILARSARMHPASPNNDVGNGYLDVLAAVNLLRTNKPEFPQLGPVAPIFGGRQVSIQTVDDCTASLLYDQQPGRLLGGRRSGSVPSAKLHRDHSFDLSTLTAGRWYFEIHLFANGWRTIADNGGAPWSIDI